MQTVLKNVELDDLREHITLLYDLLIERGIYFCRTCDRETDRFDMVTDEICAECYWLKRNREGEAAP